MRWGYKHGRELARRMPSYRGEYAPAHPVFPEGSRAACSGSASPAAIEEADIQYTEEDDQAIDEYTRRVVATAWHNVRSHRRRWRNSFSWYWRYVRWNRGVVVFDLHFHERGALVPVYRVWYWKMGRAFYNSKVGLVAKGTGVHGIVGN